MAQKDSRAPGCVGTITDGAAAFRDAVRRKIRPEVGVVGEAAAVRTPGGVRTFSAVRRQELQVLRGLAQPV